MRKKKSSLSIKIFFGVILSIVIPMIIMIFYMKYRYEDFLLTELQDRVDKMFEKSEEELSDTITEVTKFSEVLATSTQLIESMESENSYYEKYKKFDSILKDAYIAKLYESNQIKVTYISNQNEIYSNWERAFKDYSFLQDLSIVKNGVNQKGYLKWGIFYPGTIFTNKEMYICLVRSISSQYSEKPIGMLLVCIPQKKISAVLDKYLYSKDDFVYICNEYDEVILYNSKQNTLPKSGESLKKILQENKDNNQIVYLNNKKYILGTYELKLNWSVGGKQLKICYFSDYDAIFHQFQTFTNQINLLLAVTLLIIIIFLIIFVHSIIHPIRYLSHQMSNYKPGEEMTTSLDLKRNDEIGELNKSFDEMRLNISCLFEQVKDEQKIKEQYHINYLKAQLNPHFLFNSLGAVKWMAMAHETDKIVEMINALGDILRYSMGKGSEIVTITEEINNILGYVKIQNIRYGDVCSIEINCDSQLKSYGIIRFILQPIVENAILYGYKEKKKKNIIKIDFEMKDEKLFITVSNRGEGIEPVKLKMLQKELYEDITLGEEYEQKKYNKIGLKNVHDQIRIRFGTEFGLSIDSVVNESTTVLYTLPIVKMEESNDKSNDS